MGIKHWPATERPREKLLQQGAKALSDAELLSILLGTGTRGSSALTLARDMLVSAGGLTALLSANRQALCAQPGVGEARYALLKAALEIARRQLHGQLSERDVLSSPADTRRFLLASLGDQPREVFAVMFLDNRHRIISFDELFFGTIDGASVYPREVVRAALEHNAAAVILAHNHPSGVAEPSHADRQITQRLKDALALIDVRVLDHMIVGEEVLSFAERGLL